MSNEALAKEASILEMVNTFLPGRRDISGIRDALLNAVKDYPASAVNEACRQFSDGRVLGHNNAYAPNGAELAVETRRHMPALPPDPDDLTDMRNLKSYPIGELPVGINTIGPLEIDFGRGRVDLRHMSTEDKEAVLQHHGIPPAIASDAVRPPQLKRMR